MNPDIAKKDMNTQAYVKKSKRFRSIIAARRENDGQPVELDCDSIGVSTANRDLNIMYVHGGIGKQSPII